MRKLLFRRGFTDKLYYYNFRAVWLFVIFCYLLTALSGERYLKISDLSIVSVGIPGCIRRAWSTYWIYYLESKDREL